MKKTAMSLLLVTFLLGSLLTACSGNANNNAGTPTATIPPASTDSTEASPSPSPEPEESQEPEDIAASSTDKIVNTMLEQIEQPGLIDLTLEGLKDYYGIDPEIVEAFTIKTPAFNLIANEVAVIKVKDVKDIDAVKKGMEQRAIDVQKMFEQYLPEPYKNAQNYKIAAEGSYVLFLISESADDLVKAFKEAASK